MAHNLNRTNGKYSFAARGQKAWHGLGQYVDEPMNAVQVLELSGLNFRVEQLNLLAQEIVVNEAGHPTAMHYDVENRVANVRMDTKAILGIVSPQYQVLQNDEAFNFFDPIVERGEAIYETAGALGKGERIFLTAKMPDDITIKGEKIEQYVLLTNGHDGCHALVAMLTPIRVVCNNTLTAALNGKASYKVIIYHQKNMKDKLAEAHKVLGMQSEYVKAIQPIYERMANTKISEKVLKELLSKVFAPQVELIADKQQRKEVSTRAQNLMDSVMDFAINHETQKTDTTKKTVFGAFNAVSGYLGWQKNYKNANDKMKDITFGQGSRQIQKAFDLCLDLC